VVADVIISLTGIFFSFFLLIGAKSFPESRQQGVFSAAFFPNCIAIILLLLSLMIAIGIIRKLLSNKQKNQVVFVGNPQGFLDIVKVLVLILIYCVLWMTGIGHYLINSMVILVFIQRVFNHGEKSLLSSVIFTAVVVVFIYCLFKFGLRVPL